MQPILAESVPHRSRALVIAAVLAVGAAIATAAAAVPRHHHGRWHRSHHVTHDLARVGQCPYVYVVR